MFVLYVLWVMMVGGAYYVMMVGGVMVGGVSGVSGWGLLCDDGGCLLCDDAFNEGQWVMVGLTYLHTYLCDDSFNNGLLHSSINYHLMKCNDLYSIVFYNLPCIIYHIL